MEKTDEIIRNKEFSENVVRCKTVEEVKELAEKVGIELTDDELQDVVAGMLAGWSKKL